jgi:uncharacterized membrane protein
MSTLVVVNYDDPYKAEEVRLKLRKLQSEYLLDLEDAVIAVKDEKGKVKLRLVSLTGAGAVSGGFCGMLIGLIFLSPLLGFAIGAFAAPVADAEFTSPSSRSKRSISVTAFVETMISVS